MNNSYKHGFLNFYVVQDTPKTSKVCRQTEILMNKQNSNLTFLNAASSVGAEIYIGGNNWRPVKNEKQVNDAQSLKLESGKNVPLYNRRILVRAKGDDNKILNYEFFPVPPTSFDCDQ